MFAQALFWSALSGGFLVLALSAYRARQDVMARTNAPNVLLAMGGIGTHEGRALKHLMEVEIVGFILAAAAALFTALV